MKVMKMNRIQLKIGGEDSLQDIKSEIALYKKLVGPLESSLTQTS